MMLAILLSWKPWNSINLQIAKFCMNFCQITCSTLHCSCKIKQMMIHNRNLSGSSMIKTISSIKNWWFGLIKNRAMIKLLEVLSNGIFLIKIRFIQRGTNLMKQKKTTRNLLGISKAKTKQVKNNSNLHGVLQVLT